MLGKPIEGIRMALKQNTDECKKTAVFIAENVVDPQLKKSLWIEIFNYNNQNNLTQLTQIIKESKNVLQIEDLIPYIDDSMKIEEVKTKISECISKYESGLKKIEEDIKKYDNTMDKIKTDIDNNSKGYIKLKYNDFKCEICGELIRERDIYIFPCGHKFDMICIKKALKEYELSGVDKLKANNERIDTILNEIGYSENKPLIKQIIQENQNEGQKKSGVISKLNSLLGMVKNKVSSDVKDKKDDKKDVNDKQEIKMELERLLCEQCVLCGDIAMEAIQKPLCSAKIDDNGNAKNQYQEFEFKL
jgi:hypothetical protein